MKIKFNIDSSIKKEEVLDKAKKVLFDCMLKMQELAIMKAPVDQGILAGSIHLYPMTPGFKEYLLWARSSYSRAVEFGTSPHFVPIEPLKGWAARKLGDQSLAWAVRAKIAKVGTDAHPFFRPAMDEVKNVWLPRYIQQNIGSSATPTPSGRMKGTFTIKDGVSKTG